MTSKRDLAMSDQLGQVAMIDQLGDLAFECPGDLAMSDQRI